MSLVMPQTKRLDPSIPPPIGKRRCPYCGEPMFLLSISRADEGHDQRTFECSTCPYAYRISTLSPPNGSSTCAAAGC